MKRRLLLNLFLFGLVGKALSRTEYDDFSLDRTGRKLSEKEKENIKTVINQKLGDFQNNLRIIADKSKPMSSRNSNIEFAKKLFKSKAKMEVSNIHFVSRKNPTGVVSREKIGDYLIHLRDLPNYDEVIMDFIKVQDDSLEVLENDPRFILVRASFEQQFHGIKGNDVTYHDVTMKRVLVKISRSHGFFTVKKVQELHFEDVIVLKTIIRP